MGPGSWPGKAAALAWAGGQGSALPQPGLPRGTSRAAPHVRFTGKDAKALRAGVVARAARATELLATKARIECQARRTPPRACAPPRPAPHSGPCLHLSPLLTPGSQALLRSQSAQLPLSPDPSLGPGSSS